MSLREYDQESSSVRVGDDSDIDHQTWQLLVEQTREALTTFGARLHPAYIRGFEHFFGHCRTIPSLPAMNTQLGRYGWSLVYVGGYLPPRTYANLVAQRTLPIVREIRRRRDLEHSPVPDLAHDLLGHVPMMVDAGHRRFLRRLGLAMQNAQADARDARLYLAEHEMAQLRQRDSPPAAALEQAKHALDAAQRARQLRPSALARLSRLYLWTIEFGLLGSVDDWVAYGAGILSSPAELEQLIGGRARLRPLSSDAMLRDIAFCDPQPCYYVAPNHAFLHLELDRAALPETV